MNGKGGTAQEVFETVLLKLTDPVSIKKISYNFGEIGFSLMTELCSGPTLIFNLFDSSKFKFLTFI